MELPKKHYKDLYSLFASIPTPDKAEMLLQDILTPQEIESLAERWQIIQLLGKNVPQREISKELGISISKVTRGSRALQYGAGGFRYFLEKLGITKK